MNTKQKLHQIKLQQWASRFQEQASSGLTVKAWCTENNISIHTYNYWKHLLKQEYVESTLSEQHDIVPLTMHAPIPLQVFISSVDILTFAMESIPLLQSLNKNTICLYSFPIPCFSFADGQPAKSKGYYGKGMDFYFSTSGLNADISPGLVLLMK